MSHLPPCITLRSAYTHSINMPDRSIELLTDEYVGTVPRIIFDLLLSMRMCKYICLFVTMRARIWKVALKSGLERGLEHGFDKCWFCFRPLSGWRCTGVFEKWWEQWFGTWFWQVLGLASVANWLKDVWSVGTVMWDVVWKVGMASVGVVFGC